MTARSSCLVVFLDQFVEEFAEPGLRFHERFFAGRRRPVFAPGAAAFALFGGAEEAAFLHAAEHRIHGAGAHGVAVAAQFLHHPESDDGFLAGVVEDVQADEAGQQFGAGVSGARGGAFRFHFRLALSKFVIKMRGAREKFAGRAVLSKLRLPCLPPVGAPSPDTPPLNIVSISLRRPLTVVVLVIAVCLGGWLGVQRMSRDIFPPLGIPTIYVAQPFGGMDPAQMEGYLTYYYEYHFLYITGIEHVESKNIQGASIMKLQFHPGTDMSAAMAETVAYVNRARAFMPPGTPGPFITRFDAGSVRGGASRLLDGESRAHRRPDAGRGAEHGAPAFRHAAGRVGAAALRRQRAHHRGQCEAGPDAGARPFAG